MGRAHLGGEFCVLDDHVMLSDQLRREMAVDVTGRVLVTSLVRHCDRPKDVKAIELHPLFQSVSTVIKYLK